MFGSPFRARTVLIIPLVLLAVGLLEEIVTYEARLHVRDLRVRVAVIMVLNGALFALAAVWIGPWLLTALSRARKGSREGAGMLGIWVFYAVAYGALFYAYLIIERRGVGALLQ